MAEAGRARGMSELFYNNPAAPLPEKLHLGVAIGIFRGKSLLLDHRRDGGWALFGGAMEVGESLEECARRELDEELRIRVGLLKLVGVFSEPSRIIRHADGTVVQSVTVAFSAAWEKGDFALSSESRDAQWFSAAEIDPDSVAPTHRMIIPCLFDPAAWPMIR